MIPVQTMKMTHPRVHFGKFLGKPLEHMHLCGKEHNEELVTGDVCQVLSENVHYSVYLFTRTNNETFCD